MVGCFLSSERELGKQRREINWLRRNHRPSEPQGSETHPSAGLMTRNKELIEKISSLSSELKESKRMVEDLQSERHQRVTDSELKQQLQASQEIIIKLEAEQQRLAGVNFENQQLREEIANLQNQLQASEIRSESAWQNRPAEDYEQLQKEVVELRQQSAKGQATARELEAVQEQLRAVESREMILKEQQHNLEAQIKNLQRGALYGKKRSSRAGCHSRTVGGNGACLPGAARGKPPP